MIKIRQIKELLINKIGYYEYDPAISEGTIKDIIKAHNKITRKSIPTLVCNQGYNSRTAKITRGVKYKPLFLYDKFVLVLDDSGMPSVFLKSFFDIVVKK